MLFAPTFAGLTVLVAAALSVATPTPKDTKYFHEPGTTDLTGHYDVRYFREVVDYVTRQDTLTHMVRAWLKMTAAEDIETWIAHGTLLGWWWNGKLLPWDWDLDVQMHADTLTVLGHKHNQTHYHYKSNDGTANREYFLDVNPWSWQRTRGDGQNIIDARWIDMRNGLFIDITGIAVTNKKDTPDILECKNSHKYHHADIWPLRDTTFEDMPAKIPYNFDEILVKEYKSKALVVTEYEGHRWNVQKHTWEVAPDVPMGGTKNGEMALKHLTVPPQYDSVETGNFFYNIFRLFHWW